MAEPKMRNSYSMGREDFEMLKKVRAMLRAPTDSEAIRQALEEIHDPRDPKGQGAAQGIPGGRDGQEKARGGRIGLMDGESPTAPSLIGSQASRWEERSRRQRVNRIVANTP